MIDCITVVLRHAPQHWPSGTRLVGIALADHVNAEGEAFPTIRRLAHMTGMTTRSVQRHLRQLEDDGYIAPIGQRLDPKGIPRATVYKWLMWTTDVKSLWKNPDPLTPVSPTP